MIVSLCGFMGAGKSTIGKHLARCTGYDFIDLDSYIEQKYNCTVPEFFRINGESAFRAEELLSLQEILEKYLSGHKRNLILSLGGGTVTTGACAKLVKENTYCIYLFCSKEVLLKRLKRNISNRPVLKEKSDYELEEHICNLMQQREAIYRACARATIDTGDGKIQDVIGKILDNLS